jgi:hypothetical protein
MTFVVVEIQTTAEQKSLIHLLSYILTHLPTFQT